MENKTNWCVYMHENRVNGKKYIGITSQKPTRRWQNGRHYEECTAFFRAIKKYGWDGFRHEILFTELTQENAERLEVEMIAKYQTTDPEHGYNISPGGAAGAGWRLSPETKARLSAARRGVPLSEEHKKRIGDAQRGPKNHMYGKHLTAEHKTKMSQALTGRTVSPETCSKISEVKRTNSGRAVRCKETGEIYSSLSGASEKTGVRRGNINMCCLGKRQTAGGYHWEYADEAVVANG